VRVGVVTTSYPRGPADPAGAFVRDAVHRLAAGGAAVDVIAAGAEDGEISDGVGVRVIRLAAPAALLGGLPEALDAGGAAIWAAAAALGARFVSAVAAHAERWDEVESHWLVPSALAVACVAPGRPHRGFAHGSDVALLERLPLGDALARALVRGGVRPSFVSVALRARFARLCGVPAETVGAVAPAAVDAGVFAPRSPAARAALRRSLGITGTTVLGVGRLVPIKGFDLLVRAVGRLPPSRRPAVVILGEGPCRAALQQAAARRRVALRLPGAVPRAEVADWMAAADLLVHPSRPLAGGRVEGMPVAPREALAIGLPVVAARSGGLAELAHAAGLTLVAPDDAAALAAALAAVP
jgi:glycosyltransferase involved in cell wall biosynthesis